MGTTNRPMKYVDVQFAISGGKFISSCGLTQDHTIADQYDEERDIVMYTDVETKSSIKILHSPHAIFFPKDIHRPQISLSRKQTVKKSVVNVSINPFLK